MTKRTVTRETQEVCSLCGGRGREDAPPHPAEPWFNSSGVSYTRPCRQCNGEGITVVRVTIAEESE